MGILNRIIFILILLAAAGAAVLSYFLFEKRNQMLQGWEQMAAEIHSTAEYVDKTSGTKFAEFLSAENLSHKRSLPEIAEKLKNLSESAKKIIQQRDDLAQKIQQIAAASEVNSVVPGDLCSVEKYSKHSAEIIESVQKIQRRNNDILNQYIALGSRLGVAGSASAIKEDSGKNYSASLGTAINRKNDRIGLYETSLTRIGRDIGAGTFDSAEDKYKASAGAVVSGISTIKSNLNKAQSELASANAKIKQFDTEKANLQKQIADGKTEISKQNDLIKELKHKLNPTDDPAIDNFLYGKKDSAYYRNLYSMVRATVKKVDRDWNFVVLDLGANYNLKQTFAGKVYTTALAIPSGKKMSVVRDLRSSRPKFVGKLFVTEIHPDYAVANIEAPQKETVQEGDTVVFLNEDLDTLMETFDPKTAAFQGKD